MSIQTYLYIHILNCVKIKINLRKLGFKPNNTIMGSIYQPGWLLSFSWALVSLIRTRAERHGLGEQLIKIMSKDNSNNEVSVSIYCLALPAFVFCSSLQA